MSTWTLKEKSTGELEVEVSGEEWKNAVEKAFKKLAGSVEIKGFRKGQAPKKILEAKISKGERFAQAINDNLNVWLRSGLEETGVEPISQPEVDVKSMDEDKAVLVYMFTVKPEVKLGDYKGLDYVVEEAVVSDDEFNAELDRMRSTYAEIEEKETAAESGDTVNIDYEGFKDGVPFDGGKAEGYDLVLGSNSFIPGFEDQLIGSAAGEEKELNLKFPEDYFSEDLKGAEVVFKVKVNSVKAKVLPEVDDDFAKDVNAPGVETAEDLKKMIRERLENNKKTAAENKATDELMTKVADSAEVEIPDVMIEDEVQMMVSDMANKLQAYGMSLTQYLGMMGQKVDDLKEQYKADAQKSVKMRLVLEAVAKAENLAPTAEKIEEEFKKIADQYSMTVEDVKARIDEGLLKRDLANELAFNFIKENVKKA